MATAYRLLKRRRRLVGPPAVSITIWDEADLSMEELDRLSGYGTPFQWMRFNGEEEVNKEGDAR